MEGMTGTITDALVARSDLDVLLGGVKLEQKEVELLGALLDEGSRVDVVIPEDIDPGALWDSLAVCCKVLVRMKGAACKLKPLVGRMLLVVQNYPDIYQSRGYKTYDDFVTRGMEELLGISRAEAYHCKRIAKNLPWVTSAQFEQIGIAKLELLAKDEVAPKAKELLEIAAKPEVTIAALKQIIADNNLSERDRLDFSNIVLAVPKDVKKQWDEFRTNAAVLAYCDCKVGNDALIFERMIQESSGTWKAQGNYLLNKI